MRELDVFEQKVLKTIRRFSLIEPGDRVLVAVSGGPDSVALLRALEAIQGEEGFEIGLFHLDHMLRGEESAADARYVHRLAEIMHIPSFVFAYDVAQYAKKSRLSLEEAGRKVRYQLLERVAEREKYDRIAVAHHLDDRVETFLMRLIRGASLDGLASIPVRRGRVIRPLFEVTKSEILNYLKRIGQDYRIDETNLGSDNFRARVRTTILPLFMQENPQFKVRLVENLEGMREDVAFLESFARLQFERHARVDDGLIRIPIETIRKFPRALALRILRQAFAAAGGDLKELRRVHLEDLYSGLRHRTGFELDLPGKVLAVTEYGDVLIGYAPRLLREEIEPFTIEAPGEYEVKPTVYRLRVSQEILPSPGAARIPSDPTILMADADRVAMPLFVRSWHKGDYLKPLGMSGTRKVHDILVDEKIPRRLRKQIPLVFDSDGKRLIWVAGVRMSDDVRVTAETTRVLVIELVQEKR